MEEEEGGGSETERARKQGKQVEEVRGSVETLKPPDECHVEKL